MRRITPEKARSGAQAHEPCGTAGKVAKVQGQLAWHRHDGEDELFQVVRGRLRIQFEGGAETVLEAGEFCVVPKGVLHNPVADEECWIVLVETVTTKHTGDVETPLTCSIEQQLA